MDTNDNGKQLIRVHFRVNNEARKMLELSDLSKRVKEKLGMKTKPRAEEKRFELTEEAWEELKRQALRSGLSVNSFLNLMFVKAGEEFAREVEVRGQL